MSTTTEKLSDLCRNVKLTASYGAKMPYEKQDEWQQKSNGWRCALRYQGRRYAFDFWQGPAITGEPQVGNVMDCLLSDANAGDSSFEDFCSELGCDSDSRKAEKTWKLCQKTSEAMKRLLGEDYERFLYADRND